MKLRERAICLYKILKNTDGASLRKIVKQLSIPKSSIQRHKHNQQSRVASMGHDFFETEVGFEWLRQLFFSVIFIFGIQSGVGAETISIFFNFILVSLYAGSSATRVRQLKQEMRDVIDEYGATQMDEVIQHCKNKELHLGGDETGFGQFLFLILMEIKSGFIFVEELVTNRKYKTWWKHVRVG